jgi:hypothetical protein
MADGKNVYIAYEPPSNKNTDGMCVLVDMALETITNNSIVITVISTAKECIVSLVKIFYYYIEVM